MNKKISFIVRYASVPALVAAASVLRHLIAHRLDDYLPTWITFYPTVMVVALTAGFTPGILATLTSVFAVCVFFPPPRSGTADAVSIALFVAMGVFMSTVAWLYRRTRERLEDQVAERTANLIRANDELLRENGDRRVAEEMLRKSENRFSIIFSKSSLPVSLCLLPDYTYVDLNEAWERLFGHTKEESIGKTSVELGINRDPERRACTIDELQRNYRVRNLDQILYSKSGEAFTVLTNVNLVEIDGEVYALTSVHDITERKRVEEQLSATVEKLRLEISGREKLEQQLLQSQKMESLGQLAGGVAHDFNNLITVISGYAQVLRESIPAEDEPLQESVGLILTASDRAAELAGSLLAFSRKQLINRKPVTINAVIDNAGKLIRRVIGERIDLSTFHSGGELLVMADAAQFEQVLMNLAINARDAMPDGGSLTISTRAVIVGTGSETQFDLDTPGRYALISVADTGSGIDKSSMERIFEPFFTTKEVGKGTGLGLSTAYGIIKQHDGSILVRSEPGKGTTFDIYLPLGEGSELKEQKEEPAHEEGGTETLLIAEDELIVRALMKSHLEKAGYKVIEADNGDEAVERFRQHGDISLVLSDVVMPGKNGGELLAEMKKIRPDVKVIFITGYAPDVMNSACMEECAGFITKPFNKYVLLKKIREVLDKKENRALLSSVK